MGLTCHAWSQARRKTVAGGGSGVVSEAHSTLIHKVGNTTPSSAVSSAFYFMGDCTVCLSICRYSSGRPLLLLTPVSRAPTPPNPPSGFLRPQHLAPRPLEGPPWTVGGDSAWRQTLPPPSLPPPTSSLLPSSLPPGAPPHPPTFKATQVETTTTNQIPPSSLILTP